MAGAPPMTAAVLWLHDHGEQNPAEFSKHTRHHLPWCNIHCPTAQLQTFAGLEKPTHAWFKPTLSGFKGGEASETPEGLNNSIKYVHERLDHLREALRIDSSRVLIGGFGQGGALAIAAGMSYRHRLAGIMCHSGYVCQPRFELEYMRTSQPPPPNREVPIMLIHGNDDETIDPSAATTGVAMLKSLGASQVIHRGFEDAAHKMMPETLSLLIDFVRSRLPVVADKPKATETGNAAAKSKTVIKMNGRGGMASAAPNEAPTEPAYAAGRPTATTDAFAVFTGNKGRKPPAMPMVQELNPAGVAPAPQQPPPKPAAPKPAPTPAAPKPAAPKPTASKPAATTPAVSADPSTARALEAGDADALRKALERRGDDVPLGEQEMMEIAKLFLGGEGNEEALKAMTSIATGQAAGNKPPPAEPAYVDSDDEMDGDDAEPTAPDVTDPTPSPSPPPPPPPLPPAAPVQAAYDLSESDGALQLVVKMPESVTSMADVEVDIGIREIEVSVQGRRLVKLPLAKDISEDDARAKFSKKARELRISAPYL